MSGTRVRESLIKETEQVRRFSPVITLLPEHKPLGEILYDRRIELGLRQLDVARSVGLTDTMIGKIEAGKRFPDINYLPGLATVLRVDLAVFSKAYLRKRAPRVYRALLAPAASTSIERKLAQLPKETREVVLGTVDRLLAERPARRSA